MEFEGRSRVHAHLDIAPLIDIVFLLLVFFMLTSTFLVPEAIELELPQSSSAELAEDTPVSIALNHLGELTLNGEPIALAALHSALKPLLAGDADKTVTVKSDAQVAVQELLAVMDEVRAAGGTNIAIATTQDTTAP